MSGNDIQLQTLADADGRLYTVDEAAVRLRVEKHTAARIARDGDIPAVKVGGAWRFPAGPFEAWVRGWWDPTVASYEDWVAALHH